MTTNSFRKGLLDGLPICLGYFAVSFAFGITAVLDVVRDGTVVQQGLAVWQAVLISMTCVTSAGQKDALSMMLAGGGLGQLALSQLVINLRYSLMSISLSQKLEKGLKLPQKLLIAFVNTDEVFAVASGQAGSVGKRYMYGLILPPWLGWAAGTFLGALLGSVLPPILQSCLGLALFGMFIAIVVPEMRKSLATALCVAIAVGLSCLIFYVPALQRILGDYAVVICAVAASALMAAVAPVKQEEDNG